ATFTAVVTNNGTSPVYQWKRNGVNVGTNSPTYTDNTLTDLDRITCELTSASICGSSTVSSNMILMYVGSPTVAPTIKIIPPGCDLTIALFSGDPVTLNTIITNGGNAPSYQWKKNGVNVGTNSPTLTITFGDIFDEITCVLTSNSPCKSTATAFSNTISIS